MSHRTRTTLLLALTLPLSAACYHAVIDTGVRPSARTIEVPWAMSFAWGLIPPPVVETAQQCPYGVARVETWHSFLNQVANALTGGIVSPISIRVTCAAGARAEDQEDTALRLDRGSPLDTQQRAITTSLRTVGVGTPVLLIFE